MNPILKMPKVELHCHLDGSLSLETVRMLAEQSKISLSLEEHKVLELLQAPSACQSLIQYLGKFDLPLKCLNSLDNFRIAAYQLMKDAAKENIMYLELRFAPLLSSSNDMKVSQIIESVISGIRLAEKDFRIKGSLIICCMRNHKVEDNKELLKEVRQYLKKGVCAIDLAGDEVSYPPLMQKELFAEAKKWNIPFTIHAGECGSIANIEDAIDLGARRIGHGIAMMKDVSVRRKCVQNKVGIEMCPTSNFQTKAVGRMDEYPILQFLKEGILVSVNTDNRMVSNTTLTKEFTLLRKYYDFDVKKVTENAIETSFADDSTKEWMIKRLNDEFTVF